MEDSDRGVWLGSEKGVNWELAKELGVGVGTKGSWGSWGSWVSSGSSKGSSLGSIFGTFMAMVVVLVGVEPAVDSGRLLRSRIGMREPIFSREMKWV